jgi:hypothetical protein
MQLVNRIDKQKNNKQQATLLFEINITKENKLSTFQFLIKF